MLRGDVERCVCAGVGPTVWYSCVCVLEIHMLCMVSLGLELSDLVSRVDLEIWILEICKLFLMDFHSDASSNDSNVTARINMLRYSVCKYRGTDLKYIYKSSSLS